MEQAPSTCRRGHCACLAGQHCDWPSVQGTQPGKGLGVKTAWLRPEPRLGGRGSGRPRVWSSLSDTPVSLHSRTGSRWGLGLLLWWVSQDGEP